MDLKPVCERLNLDDAMQAVLAPHWEASMASLPTGPLERLDPAVFLLDRAYVGLSGDIDAELAAVARQIDAHPDLRRLYWHFEQSLYVHPRGLNSGQWPAFDAQLDGRGGLFYLLACLAMAPRIRAVHAALGIPAAITQDTAGQVRCFCDEMFRRGHDGRPGIFRSQAYWLRNYTDGWLYRLGRMEYMLRPFGNVLEAFRHRETGRTVALAMPGQWVDPAGFLVGAEAAPQAPGVWQTVRAETAETAVGAPISACGFVERREVHLARREWERVLAPGDLSMEMHIPAGGSMSPEACVDSLRRGFAFFTQYFPERPIRATSCQSWIFNTQLFEILPAEANLNRFMRELYLFPIVAGPQSGLFFLFFRDRDLDIATAPETTSVQRAVKKFLLAGNRWRSGGMFFLKDDLAQFGSQVYRSAPAILR